MVRYIFNPEHDLCIADGGEDYIPPASAVEFREQCRWIERFMGHGEGIVQNGHPEEVVPWGWNRCLRKQLQREGVPENLLPDNRMLEQLRHNSRREVAVELLERLCKGDAGGASKTPKGNISSATDAAAFRGARGSLGPGIPVGGIIAPDYRIVARSMGEIGSFLEERGRVVLKAPLSGSGKGIRFVAGELMETDRGWCRRILERQGSVVVEQRLEVVQELAMLFEYGAGEGAEDDVDVLFRGYSLFYAANGTYRGNLLASNEYIEKFLERWIPAVMLEEVRCGVEGFLKEKLQGRGLGRLRGFVGVDQFVCRLPDGGQLLYNPAVEINMRMTMGHVARNIYDLHSTELGLGEGTHCLEPARGIFPCGDTDALKLECYGKIQ